MAGKHSVTQQLQARGAQKAAQGHSLVPATRHPLTGRVALVDFSGARAPLKIYTADHAWVSEKDASFLFTFWQDSLVGDDVESALGVKMHASYVRKFMDSVDEMSDPGFEQICAQCSVEPQPITALDRNPRQVAKFNSNVPHLGVSGYEASIDFYEASSFALHSAAAMGVAKGQSSVEIEPIVRINLESRLLLSLVRRTKELLVLVKGVNYE